MTPLPPNPPPTRLRKWGRELWVNALIVALVVVVMVGVQRTRQHGGGGSLPVGQAPPAFALGALATDKTWTLDDLRGRPAILHFWATWCGPCKREIGDIDALHRQADGRFSILTISDEPASVMAPFVNGRGLRLPVLYDPGGAVARAYGVSQIPMTVVLDSAGHVVHDFGGAAYADILLDHMDRLSLPTD